MPTRNHFSVTQLRLSQMYAYLCDVSLQAWARDVGQLGVEAADALIYQNYLQNIPPLQF